MRAGERALQRRLGLMATGTAAVLMAACAPGPVATPAASGSGGPGSGGATPAAGPVATPAQLSRVSLQPERSAQATIGSAGGQLELRDAKGSRYTLSVPPHALATDTRIVATPIDGVDGLPSQLGVAGGVHLQPEGLTLRGLAKLTIELAARPAGPLASFAYHGDLDQPHRYPTIIDGTSATFEIAHFSGYALLDATSAATTVAELGLLIPFDPPAGRNDQALAAIAAVIDTPASPAREQAIRDALRTWLDTGIRPAVTRFRAETAWQFEGAYADTSLAASQAFSLWAYVEKLLTLVAAWPADPALEAAIDSLVVSAATHGIATANTNCRASQTGVLLVLRLPEEFHWLRIAEGHEVAGDDPALDEDFIHEHLCVQVIYDPNGGTSFPSGIQAGQTGTLNVRAGIQVDGSEDRFDAQPEVTITPHGAQPNTVVNGRANADGRFTRQFQWAPSAPQLRLDIEACLAGMLADVCQQAVVVRGTAPSPTAAPAGQCPTYEVTLNGQVTRSTSPNGVAVTADNARGSALPSRSLLLTAFEGGTVAGRIDATYTLNAPQSGGAGINVTLVFYGRVRDDSGGAGRVALTVGGETKTFTSPLTDRNGVDLGPGVLEFPLVVRHGGAISFTVSGEARSAAGRSTIMTGSVQLLNLPPEATLAVPACQ